METFERFPLVLLSSFITTLIGMYFIEYEPHELIGVDLVLAKVAATAMLGAFVFTALSLVEYESLHISHMILSGIGFLGLVGYYYSLPDDMGGFDAWIYLLRHIFLIILFFVSILWTAFFVRSICPMLTTGSMLKRCCLAWYTVLFSIVVIVGVNTHLCS